MISKQIEELLYINAENPEIKYVSNDFSIDWHVISNLLSATENLDDSPVCLRLKRIIDPVLTACHKAILADSKGFLTTLEPRSKWTYSGTEILEIFNNFYSQPNESALAGFLRLTAVTEYALSNVYQTYFKKKSPHLLKDLLQELKECPLFQRIQIFMLQILLGTSKGVNLRNLTWHGFVGTLNPCYLSFLFVIIVSYGKQLQQAEITPKPKRPVMVPLEIQKLDCSNIFLSATVQNCNWEAWDRIQKLWIMKDYHSGIYLLLPQIEHILRKIYGQVNEIDVTADLNKYYVIMDSIFYGYVLNNSITPLVIGKITKCQELEIKNTLPKNKILEYFPRSIFYLHYDLFYANDGPRLRDKISHGEVSINESAKKIFLILVRFASLVVEYHENKHIEFDYESIFHPNVILCKNLCITMELTENVINSLNDSTSIIAKQPVIFKKSSKSIQIDEINIHHRPALETQVVKLILQILDTFALALTSLKASSSELCKLYSERKLSSSRRDMLFNFVNDLPKFSTAFTTIFHVLAIIFIKVQKLDDKFDSDSWSIRVVKILRQTLQMTQVYQKYFSTDNRNYHEAALKTCQFLSQTVDKNNDKLN